MPFVIESIEHNGIRRVMIKNKNTGEHFSVVPEFGANLNELVVRDRNENLEIIRGYKSREEFLRLEGFKNVLMVPFPNRIENGEYEFQGRKYRLPINEESNRNSLHGLVYSLRFNLVEKMITDDFGAMGLELFYDRLYAGYPFAFRLLVRFILWKNSSLEVIFVITNVDKVEIPMGVGWHPIFELGDRVDCFQLKLPVKKMFVLNDRMIPNGETVNYEYANKPLLIENRNFDSAFLVDNSSPRVTTEIFNIKRKITIKVWQEVGEKKFNFLQVYTPPDRRSIAIEPMSCNINAFNNKEGLIVMKPGEEISLRCGVHLK